MYISGQIAPHRPFNHTFFKENTNGPRIKREAVPEHL